MLRSKTYTSCCIASPFILASTPTGFQFFWDQDDSRHDTFIMQICGSPHRTDSPSSWVGGCRSNESTWRVLKFETFPPPNKNTRNKGPLNNRPRKFETFKRKGCEEGKIYRYQPTTPINLSTEKHGLVAWYLDVLPLGDARSFEDCQWAGLWVYDSRLKGGCCCSSENGLVGWKQKKHEISAYITRVFMGSDRN